MCLERIKTISDFLDRHKGLGVALLFVLPALVFAAFTLFHHSESFVTSDTPGYMYFSPDRPVGYPLFLAMTKTIFGNYTAAISLQLGLLCAALWALSVCFYFWCGSFWKSLVFEFFLVLNPGLFLLTKQLMSDGLSAVCIASFAAFVLIALRGSSPHWGWGLIVLTCFSVVVRPVNLALVPAAFLLLWLYGQERKALCFAQIVALLFGLLVAQQATSFVHRMRGETVLVSDPLSRGLFQKTLFRQWPRDVKADACDGQYIAEKTRDVDLYLARMPVELRPYLYEKISGYLRFNVIIPGLIEKHGFERFSDPDNILMCYTVRRMISDPFYFAASAVEQFWNLLTYSTYVSASTHDRLEGYLKENPVPLPRMVARKDMEIAFDAQAAAELGIDGAVFASEGVVMESPKARPQLLAKGLQAFQLCGALIMLWGMLSLFVKRAGKNSQRLWQAIGILGIAFWGEMWITAIVEIAFPRYVYPLWPLLCTAIALALLSAGPVLVKKAVALKQKESFSKEKGQRAGIRVEF